MTCTVSPPSDAVDRSGSRQAIHKRRSSRGAARRPRSMSASRAGSSSSRGGSCTRGHRSAQRAQSCGSGHASRGNSCSRAEKRGKLLRRHTVSEVPSGDALAKVAVELGQVHAALNGGGQYLGMSGSILEEYSVDLAKKDNILRIASHTICTLDQNLNLAPPYHQVRHESFDPVPPRYLRIDSRDDLVAEQQCQVPLDAPLPAPYTVGIDNTSEVANSKKRATSKEATGTSPVLSNDCPSRSGKANGVGTLIAPHCTKLVCLEDVDCSSLVTILSFLEMHQKNARAQKFGINAIVRLARDEAQLRPLCLAVVIAVSHAISIFPADTCLQRACVAAFNSLVYKPEVAKLVAQDTLPALIAAMVTHAQDVRLQNVACEALARLVQAGEFVVVKAVVQAALWREEPQAVEACSKALARLLTSGVCQPGHILDTLLPLTESQPSHLMIQYRASALLCCLVRVGAIDKATAVQRAPSLLSEQWANLLARFAGASCEEAVENQRFHADVQTLFHDEVGKHFEYESAERSLHMLRRREPPMRRLKEVIRCLVENLEDYQSRLQARELAWDEEEQSLVSLSAPLCEKLSAKAFGCMEVGLVDAFRAAAVAEGAHGEALLSRRTATFRASCASLLEKKTEATQAHHERMEDLRREVMLFEAVEYLELHSKDASATQIRTARYMLSAAEEVAPPEALERLRSRLEFIATSRSLLVPCSPAQ